MAARIAALFLLSLVSHAFVVECLHVDELPPHIERDTTRVVVYHRVAGDSSLSESLHTA